MSWYRKYRPQTFTDLVGQDVIRQILLTSLQEGKVVHAYLFSGARGTGKTSTARILGKALNCLQLTPQGEPCNACSNCLEIDEQRFVDLIEIDAASNTGVDHIRDLREKIGFSPTQGRAKVYIIDEVHMLSSGAFNALLKTLEEPPAFVYFILATTEVHKVPETIQSRCQRFSFRRITSADILKRLLFIADNERIEAEKSGLEIIANHAAGGLRDAISLFEQYASSGQLTAESLRLQMGIVPEALLQDFFVAVTEGKAAAALEILDQLIREGYALSEFSRSFLLFLREKLLLATRSGSITSDLLKLAEIFEEAQKGLRFALIPQLPLEIAVLKSVAVSPPLPKTEKEESRRIFGIFGGEKKSTEESSKEIPSTVPVSPDLITKEAEFLAPEFDLASVRQSWPLILEHVTSPSLRLMLRNAEVTEAKDDSLILEFSAQTWKEQAEKTENAKEILTAVEKVFARKVQLSATLKAVQLEPAVTEKTDEDSEWTTVAAFQEIMGVPARKKDSE